MIVVLLVSGSAWAGEARPMGDDPAVEARLKQLASELRCLVCQNQTLADSNAPLAEDLRREVREMIAKNMSDQEIIEFLVSRYGDFVLYRPPFKTTTVLLWAGPFVLVVGGGVALAVTLRRRQHMIRDAMMTEEERRQVERLLSQR
ncbi:MAG: cytochrome c-type biogenesis protein CcmH [Nitrospira sp.]|nr:cytochrome c-type biogenesis protein CcmH [Nitrospira sp.]